MRLVFICMPSDGMRSWRNVMTLLMLAFALCLTTASQGSAQDATVGYSEIKASLVKVWALDERDQPMGSGSGFIVASDSTRSWILTANHVINGARRIVVNVEGDRRDLEATVVGSSAPDTTLLRISHGHLTPVQFAPKNHDLLDGSYVAVAGFRKHDESVAIVGQEPRLFGPGTVTTLNDGKLIDLANLTIEEGLSGGPVFDPKTGEIVGMVETRENDARGGYAVSAQNVLLSFLAGKGVHVLYYASASQHVERTSLTPPATVANVASVLRAPAVAPVPQGIVEVLPGAGRALVVYNTSTTTGNGGTAVAAAAQEFAEKFGRRFSIAAFAASGETSTGALLAQEARQNNAIASVYFAPAFRATESRSTQYVTTTRWDFRLIVGIVDSFGQVWYRAEASKQVMSKRDALSAVESSIADLSDQCIAQLAQDFLANAPDDSVISNFFRYALPIANGDHKTFVALTPSSGGAKVAFLSDFSIAKQAGLQLGDTVVSINGASTVGRTQQELIGLEIAANHGETTDYEVIAADGRHVHIQFAAQGLNWYVARRQQLQK